jgi:hypothetical protein
MDLPAFVLNGLVRTLSTSMWASKLSFGYSLIPPLVLHNRVGRIGNFAFGPPVTRLTGCCTDFATERCAPHHNRL